MTPTHDTAAALEAAIERYGVSAAGGADANDQSAALHRAITAHVEAEVARRLSKPARPTPDEARRLVEEAIGAGMALACHGDWSDEQRAVDRAHADSARAALLRALGVEA